MSNMMKLDLVENQIEERRIKADLNFICSNAIRSTILHLLIKSKQTSHSLSLEDMSYKLGKFPSVILHHMEKLKEYGIVEVIKSSKYGNREKRKIWGLNLQYNDMINEIYFHIVRNFFTPAQLERMCCKNRKLR